MDPRPFHLTFDHYLTYDALTAALHELAAAYPHFVRLHAIGASHRGRTVWLLEISNWATGDGGVKPGYYIDANIHAEEICGTSVALYTAWTLVHGAAMLRTTALRYYPADLDASDHQVLLNFMRGLQAA